MDMDWTGNIPMSISDTQKTKANEVWNLIDAAGITAGETYTAGKTGVTLP